MRQYKVIWTESAVQDLEEIGIYIAHDSPTNAQRVLHRLRDRAESLWTLPDQGRFVPELLELGLKVWRELIVRPYRIVYRVDAPVVIVEIVFDGRRDAEAVLTDRLLRG